MVEIRDAKSVDIIRFLATLRHSDIEESLQITGKNISDILFSAHGASVSKSIVEHDEKIVCVFGVLPYGERKNHFWLLFSKEVDYLPVSFFKKSKIVLDELRKKYGSLENYTGAQNSFILRWLEWLKFDILPEETYNGVRIRRFYIGGAE